MLKFFMRRNGPRWLPTELLGDQQAFPVKGDTVGVRGCGREAIYVFAGSTGWVNNTGSEKQSK
jgi:hypothetical protein